MSSCLTGGGRAYAIDLEIVKSSSTCSRTSHSSSPSSTLSESSNSPLSTRKPRTPRKRPNQTFNEAAAILSTAYPKIFSTKHLTKPSKFTKPHDCFFNDSSELFLPFRVVDNSGFLLHQQPIREKPDFRVEPKAVNSYEKRIESPVEIDFHTNPSDLCRGYGEDFDAESMLDEEIEEGIDSIMGNLCVNKDESNLSNKGGGEIGNFNPLGLGFGGKFDFGFGMRTGAKAWRNIDENQWWRCSPPVDVLQISPKFNKVAVGEKKKKKVEKRPELKCLEIPKENSIPKPPKEEATPNSIPNPNSKCGLLLKLNYDEVLNAWSDRESPFSEETPGSDVPGNDVHARLAQIDLFTENGGLREASVMRYKEKRRTRLFSKKIRYQVRKVNADQRPRMKGRFVRRPNSPMSEER